MAIFQIFAALNIDLTRIVKPKVKYFFIMAEQKLGPSLKERPSTCTKLLVAAIDFGTVYSGYAYSFKSDWPNVMTNKWRGGDLLTYKAPSALLLNPDQSFNSFGFDAEKRYASLTEDGKDCKKYFFFRRFKMILKSSLEKVFHLIIV